MSWIFWGMAGGTIVVAGILLLSILILYSGNKESAPKRKRLGMGQELKPLSQRRSA